MGKVVTITKEGLWSFIKNLGTIVFALGILNSVIFYFISNTDIYKNYEALIEYKHNMETEILPQLDSTIMRLKKQTHYLHTWKMKKDSSFAIGPRVDLTTGEIKMRGVDGKLYYMYELPNDLYYMYYTDNKGVMHVGWWK